MNKDLDNTRDIHYGYLVEVNESVEGDTAGLIWFMGLEEDAEPFQVFHDGPTDDFRAYMYIKIKKIKRTPKVPTCWQTIDFGQSILCS